MKNNLTQSPADLVAVVISARRSGDRDLEVKATRELRVRFGVTLRIGSDFGQCWAEQVVREARGDAV